MLFRSTGVSAAGSAGTVVAVYWKLIDDSQTANWQLISNTDSAAWAEIDTEGAADWQLIDTVI